jgi:hypothetical protein
MTKEVQSAGDSSILTLTKKKKPHDKIEI